MEKNTKILLGVAAAGVVAYLFLKPKKVVAQVSSAKPNSLDPSRWHFKAKSVLGTGGIVAP